MNKRLWVLNPLLLATALPAWAADDSMIVSQTERTAPSLKWPRPPGLSKARKLNSKFRAKRI